MPRESMLSDRELSFLRELTRHKVPFMIVGLSSAALQGAPVVTQDVELWFKQLNHPGLKKALRKVGGIYVPPIPGSQNPRMFAGEAVELFDIVSHMHGLNSFDDEYRHALDISLGRFKVKILPLSRIIASKQAADRRKDRLVIPVLEDAIRAQKQGQDNQ